MKHHSIDRRLYRWITCVRGISMLGAIALAGACADHTTAPVRSLDAVTATASGTVRVLGHAGVVAFRGDVAGEARNGTFSWGRPRNLYVAPERAASPNLARQSAADMAAAREAMAAAAADHLVGTQVTSRKFHRRDHTGHVTSLAIVDGADAKHPKAAYQFVDGLIQIVASFSYDLAGRPSDVLYIMFDANGHATVQLRQSFASKSMAAAPAGGTRSMQGILDRLVSTAGVLATPTPLYALDDSDCSTEWNNLSAASASMAAASAQVTACTIGIGCLSDLQTASAALVTATSAWNSASSALSACLTRVSGGSSAGTSSGSGGSAGLDNTIDQFIDASSTASYCDASGDDCVYVNET